MSIQIKNVSKAFGNVVVLDDVSLEVPDGSLLALLGPSGSGKTTLLRIIAGLEVPDSGSVLYQQEDITHDSARDRKVGFVFQHYALFRHMTVAENIGYALRVRKVPKAKIRERVKELLKLIRLEGLETRYPGQLSGGQRQRVALARALAAQPRVLLLDEPFGALDAKVRQELRRWVRKLHEQIHVTSIFVTHDQEEASELADRVVVMNQGRIEQIGTPDEIYDQPTTPFVYNFLGDTNSFQTEVRNGQAEIAEGIFDLADENFEDSQSLVAYARPHLMMIHRKLVAPTCLRAVVKKVSAVGPLVRFDLVTANGEAFVVKISHHRHRELEVSEDEKVFVTPGEMKFFPKQSGAEERASDSVDKIGASTRETIMAVS
jgi:sulfate/thiosulfate transport system ATP-binding protein